MTEIKQTFSLQARQEGTIPVTAGNLSAEWPSPSRLPKSRPNPARTQRNEACCGGQNSVMTQSQY